MRTALLTLVLGAMTLPGAFAFTGPSGKSATSVPRSTTTATRTYTNSHAKSMTGSANRIVTGASKSVTGSANRIVSGSSKSRTGSANRTAHRSGMAVNKSKTGTKSHMTRPSSHIAK